MKVCLGPQSVVASSGKWKSLTKTSLLSTIVYSHTVPKMTKLKKDKFFSDPLELLHTDHVRAVWRTKDISLPLDLDFLNIANF